MLFVTGITGALGVEVLRILLQDQPVRNTTVLIRARDQYNLYNRWKKLLSIASDGKLEPKDVPGIIPVSGDITKDKLGLPKNYYQMLCNNVEAIMHSAATVDFDEPLDSCRKINVEGTRNVLNLAIACKNIKKFAHISTLYIAGKRKGNVHEEDLKHDAGFVTNGYEESKYEAEILVHQYMKKIPISIYRMSLLMGCMRDGYVHDYGAIQRYLMFMYKGIAPCFAGLPDCPLDFLPHDYSAECLMELFDNHFLPGDTYQISAGDKSPTTKRWLELTADTYAKHSKSWAKGSYNVPDIVSWGTYQLYKKTIFTIENMELMKVIRILDSCSEELFCPKNFKREKLNIILGVNKTTIPDYEEYYPRILDHCIAVNWGLSPEYEKA
jgi:long-chain acyl-CoA synthetase